MQKQIERIPAAAMKTLTNWEWPGNIRELENFIERAVILTRGKTLEVPIPELRESVVESHAPNHNGTQDEISRIVRQTITEISKDNSRSSEQHNESRRQEIMRVFHDAKER